VFYYLHHLTDVFSPMRVFRYTTFRAILAAVTAMLICFFIGPWLIRKLAELKFGQPIRDVAEVHRLAELHGGKAGLPTMGGLLIILAVLDAAILWANPTNRFVWLALLTMVGMGAIGFADDFAKIRQQKSRGIRARLKFFLQVALAAGIALFLFFDETTTTVMKQFMVPFFKEPLVADMGIFAILFAILVIVGASNAVNLTDGLDGLAVGCTITVALVYAAMSFVAGNFHLASYLAVPFVRESGELTVICAALIGASLGFLWFNCHPAQIFMGDTGSLAIGGIIGAIAVMIKQELALVIVGGIFVMEAMSVILQVASYKWRGKRVFAMAPLHHHFELKGWSETKVTTRFWILSVIFALVGLGTLKLR
jgi:phospho-N-acetylmuramoyl-pentapeptide-transferase